MSQQLGELLLESVNETAVLMKSELPLEQLFTCRHIELKIPTTKYTAGRVRQTRKLLGVSQPIFARFLGVSLNTVRAWEQGANEPSGMAARFLDEIREAPDWWRGRLMKFARPTANRKRGHLAKGRGRA